MKNRILKSIGVITCVLITLSCTKPRIDLEDHIYGDKAVITAVNVVKLNEVTNQLNYNEPVTGVQSVSVTSSSTVDKENFKAHIIVNAGTDLTKVAIQISNYAKRVEPVNGAPTPGYIRDFSKGPYVYRLHSADGTVRDWTLTFAVQP